MTLIRPVKLLWKVNSVRQPGDFQMSVHIDMQFGQTVKYKQLKKFAQKYMHLTYSVQSACPFIRPHIKNKKYFCIAICFMFD